MSFATFIKPQLYQKTEDQEWYLKAVTNSLNSYMMELESKLSIPNQQVAGVTVVPSVPPIPVTISGPLAFFIPFGLRFTFEEVKTAMWCGDGTQAFINLFNLFGTKFSANFVNMQALPVLGVFAVASIPTYTFTQMAIQLMEVAHGIGSGMTPDIFADIESQHLAKAIATIPPITIPAVGAGLIPAGSFTGTFIVNFSSIAGV